MSETLILYIVQALTAVGLLYLAFRKAPSERTNLNGNTVKNYADAAKIAGEMSSKYAFEIQEVEARMEERERIHQKEMDDVKLRLTIQEKKEYRITIDFTMGDKPRVGTVVIEPIIPELPKPEV
jgi:hypothetical protein